MCNLTRCRQLPIPLLKGFLKGGKFDSQHANPQDLRKGGFGDFFSAAPSEINPAVNFEFSGATVLPPEVFI